MCQAIKILAEKAIKEAVNGDIESMDDVKKRLAELKAQVKAKEAAGAQPTPPNNTADDSSEAETPESPNSPQTPTSPKPNTPPKPVTAQAGSMPLRSVGVCKSFGGNQILHNITLTCPAGGITAILGPSGSGKSTLLKCLASVHAPNDGTLRAGDIDIAKDKPSFRQHLGYVPQDDIIHRELKVEDAFRYAARLRLGDSISADELSTRIDGILDVLGLEERRGLRIQRLSGGQRKRVNIGVELLAEPQVLILDEPASGLDPGTEEDLLDLLRLLAEEGRTIALTTHSMEYLDKVDRIAFLMEGHLIYAGNLSGLLSHFSIAHVADIFKTIREKPASQWASKYRAV